MEIDKQLWAKLQMENFPYVVCLYYNDNERNDPYCIMSYANLNTFMDIRLLLYPSCNERNDPYQSQLIVSKP